VCHDRRALSGWLTLVIAISVVTVAQIELWNSPLRFNGDEPSNLMAVISVTKNHTLNVYPSYAARDFITFGISDLQWQVPPANGFIPPEHGIGFPAFVAPFYVASGVVGTRMALIGINCLVFPLLFLNCLWSGLSRLSAGLACVALAAALPWEVHVGIVVPEALAGTITMGILAAFLRFKQTGHWAYALGVGLGTVLLPIIYLKYGVLAIASGTLLLADRRLRINPATYAAAPLAGAYALLWIAVYGCSVAIGTGAGPNPFNLSGFAHQFWAAFIDRDHGEWVWAPVTMLAALGLLWRRPNFDVQAYLLAAILLYATLYGLTTLKPGDSAPGRYLVAALPAMVMLAATSILYDGRMYHARVAIFTGFVLLSGGILFGSIMNKWPSGYASAFPQLY
jgi:hypothetical protein